MSAENPLPDDDTVADTVSVVRKVRMILDAFGLASTAVGITELARRTGLAKTSVHRVAAELAEVGLLERHGRGYQLGAALFMLGARVPRTRALRLLAARYLEDLAATTRETVVLALPGEHEVVFAEKYFGQRAGGVTITQVEGRVPFHCGASGKALLAFGDPDIRRRVLAAPLRHRTPWTITEPVEIEHEIERTRERGYAIDRQELVIGYAAVGAPVFAGGVAVATLTVVAPNSRLDVRQLAPVVAAAGRALTRDIGNVAEIAAGEPAKIPDR